MVLFICCLFVVVVVCCCSSNLLLFAAVARVTLAFVWLFGFCSCLFVFAWLEVPPPPKQHFPCNFRSIAPFLSQSPFLVILVCVIPFVYSYY